MSSRMTPDLIEVFRSPDRAQCDDRAFMLSAVNIPSEVDASPTGYVVRVPYAQAAFATHHLWQYEQELRRRPRVVLPPARVYPHAWVGSAIYVALLALVAMIVVRGWWRPDTFAIGTLDAAAVQAGQWWRAITALTLHLDIVHLMMNLGAGAAIGFLASRQIGAGHAWLLTVLGAGTGQPCRGVVLDAGTPVGGCVDGCVRRTGVARGAFVAHAPGLRLTRRFGAGRRSLQEQRCLACWAPVHRIRLRKQAPISLPMCSGL